MKAVIGFVHLGCAGCVSYRKHYPLLAPGFFPDSRSNGRSNYSGISSAGPGETEGWDVQDKGKYTGHVDNLLQSGFRHRMLAL